MKVLIFAIVAMSAVLVAAPAPTVEAAPCHGEPPAELERCGIGGHRVYVCGEYVTNYCIWGP